jgi:DNA-binding IscR family transcriptional regulator
VNAAGAGIHRVMLEAEKAMRDALAARTLADVAQGFGQIAPASFFEDVEGWIGERMSGRTVRSGKPRDAPS